VLARNTDAQVLGTLHRLQTLFMPATLMHKYSSITCAPSFSNAVLARNAAAQVLRVLYRSQTLCMLPMLMHKC